MTPRVLHVIPAVAPRYGGPSRALAGMCRAVQAAGVPVVVATTDADGDGRLQAGADGSLPGLSGVRVQVCPRRLSESYKWSPDLARWLDDHVFEFDLVHVHAVFSHSTLAAGRACLAAGVPYIVRPLGSLDPWSLAQHGWRKTLLLKLGLGRVLQSAAAMHYTTADEARLAESAVDVLPPGFVVPLGVEDDLFRDADDGRDESSPRMMLALTRVHPKKGLDVLVDAFLAATRDPRAGQWVLVIAGDGEPGYLAGLKRRAEAAGGAGRVQFRGWVEGADRRELFQRASVFALPSQQENFGLAVAEAMAAGCPVVVSPAVNLSSEILAAGAGWVVEPTVPALTEVFGTVVRNEQLTERGRSARRLAERFRWSRIGEALAERYASLAAARRVRPGGEEALVGGRH